MVLRRADRRGGERHGDARQGDFMGCFVIPMSLPWSAAAQTSRSSMRQCWRGQGRGGGVPGRSGRDRHPPCVSAARDCDMSTRPATGVVEANRDGAEEPSRDQRWWRAVGGRGPLEGDGGGGSRKYLVDKATRPA